MVDFAAKLWSDKTWEGLKTLRGTPDALAALLRERRATLAKIANDPYASDLAKRELRAKAEVAYRDQLESLRASASRAKREVERAISDALHVKREPQEELAYETRAARTWARYKGLLDADAVDVLALVEREKDSLDGLHVLAEELPDYLATRNTPPALWDAIKGQLAAYERPLLSDTARLARDQQDEVADGWPRVETAMAYADAELETGDRWTVLPAWQGGGATVDAS